MSLSSQCHWLYLSQVIPLEIIPYFSFPVTILPWFFSLITGQSNFLVFSQSSMLVHIRILAFIYFSSISTTHSQGELTWTLGFKYSLFADDLQIYTLIYLALMSPWNARFKDSSVYLLSPLGIINKHLKH